jgi:hypothetical protein
MKPEKKKKLYTLSEYGDRLAVFQMVLVANAVQIKM